MEDTELEEGEALCYNVVEEDSTIDPDVALSYIGEKLQDVLGHFQKDFEGGVSAENLGAKFGGYGSFLPTYQRCPSRFHAKTAPEIQKNSIHSEDQRQSSSASRSVSPTARLHDTSGKTMLMGNSLKVDVDLPFRQVNESSLNRGVAKKSVNTSDQRILKVRIKVGSHKVSTQKNADIYNGLGLVVSPSSLLDESPATSQPSSHNLLDLQGGSPISICQTMTSFYGGLLLSPLSEDLIHLMEKRKLGVIGESEVDKLGTKKSGLYKGSSDKNNSVSGLKKETETDIDAVECDELVSSALKLPLLSNSHHANDVVIGMNGDLTSFGMAGKNCLDTEPAQDICRAEKLTESLGLSTGLLESKQGKFDSSIAACSLHDVRKRESDLDGSRASKRLKENEQFDYEKGISDHGGDSIKTGSSISSLKPEIYAPSTSDYCLLHSSICDNKDSVRKRKGEEHLGSQSHMKPLSFSGHCQQSSGEFVDEMCESDHMKEKKARVSNSRSQQNGHYLSNSQAEDYLKGDRSLVRSSVTANSSSSKVSGSLKHKACAQEVKGSPVESVSSYPLRFYNADKATSTRKNLIGTDEFQDSRSLTVMSPKRFSAGEDDKGNDQTAMVKKDVVVCDIPLGQDNHSASEKYSFEQCQIEGKSNAGLDHGGVSHLKKREQGLASHKDKTRNSGSDSGKEKIKAPDPSRDYLYHEHDEEYKSRRNKFEDESSPPGKAEKFVCKKDTAGGTLSESSKGRGQIKYEGHDGQEVTKKRHNLLQEHDDKKSRKKSDQVEVNGNGNSLSLPPLARIQTETVACLRLVSGSQKDNIEKSAFDNGDALKASRQSMKPENQNVQPSSSRNPKLHKARDAEVPSPVRRDSYSQAANNALKEAKDLKHLADRLKHSGSGESNGLYFEASLKFLHAASLLESGSTEGSKHNDVHSVNIYNSTAKLCEFCAHEYEKSKDMATAALAYKCTEVAYMRVVYSSHSRASKDRNDLQTSLQIRPGDSPSSSASDVDNLNHASTDNSAGLTKVGEPGSHVITSQNRSGFMRLLNFARDITFALEASRKSRNAYAAASSKLGETLHKDGITSLKKALDFNFQDVQGLLRLVRVSMEAINS